MAVIRYIDADVDALQQVVRRWIESTDDEL